MSLPVREQVALLADPDVIGTSAYRAVYELVNDIVDSDDYDHRQGNGASDRELRERILGSLDDVIAEVQDVKAKLA